MFDLSYNNVLKTPESNIKQPLLDLIIAICTSQIFISSGVFLGFRLFGSYISALIFNCLSPCVQNFVNRRNYVVPAQRAKTISQSSPSIISDRPFLDSTDLYNENSNVYIHLKHLLKLAHKYLARKAANDRKRKTDFDLRVLYDGITDCVEELSRVLIILEKSPTIVPKFEKALTVKSLLRTAQLKLRYKYILPPSAMCK